MIHIFLTCCDPPPIFYIISQPAVIPFLIYFPHLLLSQPDWLPSLCKLCQAPPSSPRRSRSPEETDCQLLPIWIIHVVADDADDVDGADGDGSDAQLLPIWIIHLVDSPSFSALLGALRAAMWLGCPPSHNFSSLVWSARLVAGVMKMAMATASSTSCSTLPTAGTAWLRGRPSPRFLSPPSQTLSHSQF